MNVRIQMQFIEALGDKNRWYCSQKHLRPVAEEEVLMTYFIRSGGAANFAVRWEQAMSAENRWYCSEYYGYQVADEEALWNYFMDHRRDGDEADKHSASSLMLR